MADEKPNWAAHKEMDPILDLMDGLVPMTAENYHDLANAGPRPTKPMTREQRNDLPEPLQDGAYPEDATGPRNATPGQVPNTADVNTINPDTMPANPAFYHRDRQDI